MYKCIHQLFEESSRAPEAIASLLGMKGSVRRTEQRANQLRITYDAGRRTETLVAFALMRYQSRWVRWDPEAVVDISL